MNNPEHNRLDAQSPDATTIELTPAEKAALKEMIDDRIWWDQAVRRARKWGIAIAAGAATLAFLAVWWPWITSVAQAILKDVPR